MTIKYDRNIPVYFFEMGRRKIIEGRFLRVSNSKGIIVEVPNNDYTDQRPIYDYFSERDYKFHNDRKSAKQDGIKFLKSKLADKKEEIKQIYKEIWVLK
jgi:hypothetical protein